MDRGELNLLAGLVKVVGVSEGRASRSGDRSDMGLWSVVKAARAAAERGWAVGRKRRQRLTSACGGGHNSINIHMSKKFQKIQLEKNVLSNQLYGNQKEIQKLKADLESSEKIAAEQNLYHEMKKDELVSQILYLQKEVSHLSSSALAQEKEALRKELDKSKSKLKDTESKLKNVIQDMVKLEVINFCQVL
ncbi:hypothetical protein KSP40_PGU016496 [Platanthera guangdongensis]|uniref:Uncharacterized protein n=1 Tax=Platanthera guangdongensis TaxID=2320717 RepID=A0ABR2MPH0_9ASPA